MIRRELDPELPNRIASDPAVRPFVCYHDHEIDFWPAMRGCVILTNGEDAMAAFEQTGSEREWMVHTFFLPSCRGKRALETAREMLDWMMPKYADRIWGVTPLSNRAARLFNRLMGGRPLGFDEYEVEGPVEIFEIRASQWQ